MRFVMLAAVAGAVALGTVMGSPGPAVATKTKMGCDSATEVWDATLGKCQPGTPKHRKTAVKTTAAKKAPAKKAPAQ